MPTSTALQPMTLAVLLVQVQLRKMPVRRNAHVRFYAMVLLRLSMCGVSEIAHINLTSIVPEVVSESKEEYARFGRPSSKPRPLLVSFTSDQAKHVFLRHAKTFRQAGIRCDDYLTRLQQQERQALSEDFTALKAKGHKPFFRGSELKYHHADKMYTCRQSQAHKAPVAKS